MGPKIDTSGHSEKLEECREESIVLYEDISLTVEKGKTTVAAQFESKSLKLFKARLSRLDATFEKFIEYSTEAKRYARYLKDEEAINEIKELVMKTREFYYEAMAIPLPSEDIDNSLNSSHSNSQTSYDIRLPNINIPTFDGDITKWVSYKDTFMSMIHGVNLSGVKKFHYLKSSLSGLALQAIASIPISEQGYTQAWEALTKKFDNKRVQAATCLAKIFNYSSMGKANLTSLQDFSSNVIQNALAYQNLALPDSEGFILMSYCLRLLDQRTREKFETENLVKENNIPKFTDFIDFIHRQVNLYQSEIVNSNPKDKIGDTKPSKPPKDHRKVFVSAESTPQNDNRCVLCKNKHKLYRCDQFLKLTPRQRFNKIRTLKTTVCLNCLNYHDRAKCPSDMRCIQCKLNHNTLLHFASQKKSHRTDPKPPTTNQGSEKASNNANSNVSQHSNNQEGTATQRTTCLQSHSVSDESYALLGTAIGFIQDHSGSYHKIRILVDLGAQRSWITTSCVKKLGLKLSRSFQTFSGFGNQPIKGGSHQALCRLAPRGSRFPELLISAVVANHIIGPQPLYPLPEIKGLFDHLELADPQYWNTDDVDFVIGVDSFGLISKGGIHRTVDNGPYAIDTILGWVVMGPTDAYPPANNAMLLTTISNPPLETLLQNFWEIEDVSKPTSFSGSPEEEFCEKHFQETHSRDSSGRYIIRLPFRSSDVSLGQSYSTALRRFYNLELKLNKTPSLKEEYNKVIKEYLSEGYMSKATHEGKYFLPHHGVTKDSTTTRLRVVFDASMKTSLGSLNDKLYTGPKLHLDIRIVLLNFRKYPVALTADIRHMYLQILMHPDDRAYQQMVFRFDPSEPVVTYEMNRLTFGLSSAPFLAQRTIKQLVIDEGASYPSASQVLQTSTYMDDILVSVFTVKEAQQMRLELTDLLSKGGFTLQKWASSCSEVLHNVKESGNNNTITFPSTENDSIKILGLQWDPRSDCLFFAIHVPQLVLTKRAVLSAIARIFDPLGYLAPVVFRAKSFLQQLWNHKLNWDDSIPETIAGPWKDFIGQLPDIESIRISRCIFTSVPQETRLVGFADASSLGYAAVLYLRITYSDSQVVVKLIASKTRLAPIKTISIPRLELCAALLLIRLIETFSTFLKPLNMLSRHLFSDSSVVLSWLRLPPNTLKIFVANRTTEILSHSDVSDWYHVNTKQNSADIASRGLAPSKLAENSLWWTGPPWLVEHPSQWPVTSVIEPPEELPEQATNRCVLISSQPSEDPRILFMERYSSLIKLQTHVAIWWRYFRYLRSLKENRCFDTVISRSDRHDALHHLIKIVQEIYFSQELDLVSKNLGHKSKLKSLSPFIDPLGVLRVGGRLTFSPLHYDAKHPILLPSKCHLTNLVIDYLHKGYLHAGPTLLLSLLNRHYWVVDGKRVIRQRIHECLKCRRQRPTTLTPYMADLPSSRFEQGRPFLNVGVDYAGPFLVKELKLRKSRQTKSYMCIFICMSTKAVHLDLVSDLTTNAFLACLDRFVARRGLPSKIFSDHGTNFIGADRHLKELYTWMRDNSNSKCIHRHLERQGIRWIYSPPTASHMSGLWEAGVKSAKSYLNRVLGNHTLTFEELSTLLARVEAILNSRPLYATSSSPDDYSVLTPGHFLIGDAMVAPPEYDFSDTSINRLSRWQLVSRCLQQVWNKWRLDYLNSLQQRVKWLDKTAYKNLTPNSLVLLKESNVSPTHWPTARVVEVFPGKDGIVRVVKLKTVNGEYVRPVSKIALLLPSSSD